MRSCWLRLLLRYCLRVSRVRPSDLQHPGMEVMPGRETIGVC